MQYLLMLEHGGEACSEGKPGDDGGGSVEPVPTSPEELY